MSLFARAAAHYERIRHLMSGEETPEETLAFIFGYTDGEKGSKKAHLDGFYYQGYKHGVAGDAHDGELQSDDSCDEAGDGPSDDWCPI